MTSPPVGVRSLPLLPGKLQAHQPPPRMANPLPHTHYGHLSLFPLLLLLLPFTSFHLRSASSLSTGSPPTAPGGLSSGLSSGLSPCPSLYTVYTNTENYTHNFNTTCSSLRLTLSLFSFTLIRKYFLPCLQFFLHVCKLPLNVHTSIKQDAKETFPTHHHRSGSSSSLFSLSASNSKVISGNQVWAALLLSRRRRCRERNNSG